VRERAFEEKFQRQKVLGGKDRQKVLKIDDEGKRKKGILKPPWQPQ